MTGTVRTSAVKVTARGVRVERNFEIHDVAVRTAATTALARGQSLDEWLTELVLGKVAGDATAPSPFGKKSDGVGTDVA